MEEAVEVVNQEIIEKVLSLPDSVSIDILTGRSVMKVVTCEESANNSLFISRLPVPSILVFSKILLFLSQLQM